MLASFAVSKGLSYVGGKAFDAFAGTEMGQSLTGSFSNISNSYKMAAPSWAGGYTAAEKARFAAGNSFDAGMVEGGVTESVSGASSATPFLEGFDFMDVAPYAGAIVKLLQGDVQGAVATGAGVYIGLAISGGNPIIGAIGGFIFDSLFGGGGGKRYVPVPTVWRIVRVSGNNNLNAIVDLQAPFDNPPKEYFDLCDSLLKVGFNATKTAEVATGKQAPYDFLMCSMNNRDGVFFSMRKGDPNSADTYAAKVGASDKTFSSGKAASEVVKLVTTAFKEAYAADAAALDNASKLLNKKTYKELSTGLTKELRRGTDKAGTGKLDASIERGVFGGTPAEDAIIVAGRANAPQAAVSSYGDYGGPDSPPMVYSMKDGKYVEAPSEMKEVDETVDTGYGDITRKVTRKVYTPGVLMLDKDGNPIFDRNNSGGIDLADLYKPDYTVTSDAVTPTLTTTSGTITGGTTVAATTGTTGTTGNVNVVTNADNSQRNNQSINTYYASTLSKTKNPIKDAMLQTGMPA